MKNDSKNIIFFDTAPFIYLIENHPLFYDKVVEYIVGAEYSTKFYTSVITIMEFSIKPIIEKRWEVINEFKQFLKELDVKIADINLEIAEIAASLRIEYHFLKAMDALQIATAINLGCSSF